MIQLLAHNAPANSLQPDVTTAASASVLRFNRTRDTVPPFLRLDIRRSLQVHRRLVLLLALAGLALAVIYLLDTWSIRATQSVNTLQPSADRSTYNPSLTHQPAIGTIPGIAKFAAIAVAQWYSADYGAIRNAVVLFLGFIFLGAAVAVIAHKADPRIYVASDVERLLGFAPLVQLPEFTEVANEVTREFLLQLASGIDRAFKNRNLSRCVFTGVGPGVGVTSIASQVKELLESLGNAAEITDAAPLVGSEETERLVRSADCTILVIESGVTTRPQMRTVANTLQRLKAPAVGFVLNRVRLKTADPAFRRNVKAMSRRLTGQGKSTDWQMLQTLQQAIEEGSASLDLDAAKPNRPAANPPAPMIAEATSALNAFEAGALEAVDPAKLALPAELPKPALKPNAVQESEVNTHQISSSPWEETASRLEAAFTKPQSCHDRNPQSPCIGEDSNGLVQEQEKSVPLESAHIELPRLSDLRGMCFSQALRDLDRAKRPASSDAGIDVLMNAIAPFESLLAQMESKQTDALSEAAHAEPDPLTAMQAFSFPGPEFASERGNGKSANENGSRKHPSQPSLLPFNPIVPANSRSSRGDNERARSGQESGGILDQLNILPARRGQYKKKT